MTTNELDKLAPALVALQGDLKPVDKSANNPFFKSKYAPLHEVMKAIQPHLAKHRLAVSQFVTNINGDSALRTILLHESGQYIEDTSPLVLAKADPQGQGSAITYARRYGVMAVLGLVADEDDDGNASVSRSTPASKETAISYTSVEGPSLKQKMLITTLARKVGFTDVEIKEKFSQLKSVAEASKAIAELKTMAGEDE